MAFRSVLFACLIAATTGVAVGAENGPVQLDFTPFGATHVKNAPARLAPIDTSFGQYPMSVYGIANAIHRYDGTGRLDDGPIAYAIVAIRDWEARFPGDPWIARDLLYVQRVYEHAKTFEGLTYARRVAAWVQTDYPESEFARMSRTELAKFPTAFDSSMDDVPAPQPTAAVAAAGQSSVVRTANPAVLDVWSRFPPLTPRGQPH